MNQQNAKRLRNIVTWIPTWLAVVRRLAESAVSFLHLQYYVIERVFTLQNYTFLISLIVETFIQTVAPSTSEQACADESTKCDKYKKYCGINDYVSKRCVKTCGKCSKFSTLTILRHWKSLYVVKLNFSNFSNCWNHTTNCSTINKWTSMCGWINKMR